MNALPLAFLFFFSSATNPDAKYFLDRARAEPETRIEDAYKWILHAARGSEHALADEAGARKALDEEWAALGPPQADEPLWVPLAPKGRFGRLNLRPYRAQGGEPKPLLDAFLASARSYDASPARFLAAWKGLGRALKRNPQGHLAYSEWKRLDRTVRPLGYPALHHSPEFKQSRQPAYRVLTATQARPLIEALAGKGKSTVFP
ncbi:MAG: hypothetical protein AB7V14_07790 [Kiritimatiellia bacterium]